MTQDGKNILHFAVQSRNPDFVWHVVSILKEDVMQLMDGKDRVGSHSIIDSFVFIKLTNVLTGGSHSN